MVTGGDSCSEGGEFKSQHRNIVHMYLLLKLYRCLKKKLKRGRGWPIFQYWLSSYNQIPDTSVLHNPLPTYVKNCLLL